MCGDEGWGRGECNVITDEWSTIESHPVCLLTVDSDTSSPIIHVQCAVQHSVYTSALTYADKITELN